MALQDTLNKPMADPFGVASKTRAAEKAKADVGVELAQKQEQEMKPILEAERQKMTEVGAKQAQIGEQLQKPFEIPKESMGDFAQLGGLVAIVGTMLGSSGKQSANNVLGAMTGIMDGYKSGRKDVVANAYKEFDTNMKRLQGLQKQIDSELTLFLQKSATNREEAKTHLETAKALAGQGIAGVIADGQSADKVAQLQMQLKQMGQNAQQHKERIDMEKKRYEAEDQKAKITPAYTGPDGKVYNAKGEVIPLPQGLTKFGAKTLASPSDWAEEITSRTGAKLDKEGLKNVPQIAKAVGEAEDLRNYIEKNKDIIGRSGQLNRTVNRYVDSFRKGEDLSDNGQPELIFAKRYAAYLVNYERALAGGSKGFTVALQKRFNDLLQQDQFNPEGFKNLMDQHITELSTGAATFSPKLNRKNMLEIGRDIVSSGSVGAPSLSSAPPAAPTYTSPEQVADQRQKAEKAIADGYDPTAVKKRFKERTGQEF